MKHIVKFSGIAVALLVLFTACEKEEPNALNPSVEGTYKGTLASLSGTERSIPATSVITITSANEIQVQCYSNGLDTTLVMNYYHQNDSAYVCFTGDDFESMYGHMLGEGHMGGMMDDMHDEETEWMHHLGEEHDEGDEHYGGFDMANHSFSLTLLMNKDDTSDDLHFQGLKQ